MITDPRAGNFLRLDSGMFQQQMAKRNGGKIF